MTVQNLLQELAGWGVSLAANGNQLDIDAPDDVLTDELMATLRENKAKLLAALRSGSTERPRLGSFARPTPVRGNRMPSDCLWATCVGFLTWRSHNLHVCSNCATWFELLPPEDLGVYVGDLADDPDVGAKTEWVM